MTLNSSEQQRLMDDYADGHLAPHELRELVELLRTSEEVRDHLAAVAVVERLLRASAGGGVSPQRVMAHLQEAGIIPADLMHSQKRRRIEIHRHMIGAAGARVKRVRNERARDKVRWRLQWLAFLCVVTIVAMGVGVWYRGAQRKTAPERLSLPMRPQPPVAPPVNPAPPAVVAEGIPALAPRPPSSPAGATDPVQREWVRFFPPEPPAPPAGEDLSPPTGDGSDEPGFVAPPDAWLERAGEVPDARLLPPHDPDRPRPPTLCVKLRHGLAREWGVTPNDVTELLGAMGKRAGIHYGTDTRSFDEIDTNPATNPILFFTGHYHFVLSTSQRVALRRFMLDGGMLIFNAGLGSKPFYDSAQREMRLIFPELPIERLGIDHPMLHTYYDLDRVATCAGVRQAGYSDTTPWLEGITLSCRTAVVLSRWGMAAGWEGQENETFRAYRSEDALRLGINLLSYGAAGRAWTKRASNLATLIDQPARGAGTMSVAQLIHGGEWRTRYAGLSLLLHSFNQRTEVPVKLEIDSIALDNIKLFDVPLLYVTGHESLQLTAEELERLRNYLLNGGFLFAEACCGRAGFDRDFRAAMHRAFPAAPLRPISPDATLFHKPNEIELLRATPALAAKRGSALIPPRLEGIQLAGHYVVVYSPYGLAGGWERSQNPYAYGYEGSDALKLGQNILMYAITE